MCTTWKRIKSYANYRQSLLSWEVLLIKISLCAFYYFYLSHRAKALSSWKKQNHTLGKKLSFYSEKRNFPWLIFHLTFRCNYLHESAFYLFPSKNLLTWFPSRRRDDHHGARSCSRLLSLRRIHSWSAWSCKHFSLPLFYQVDHSLVCSHLCFPCRHFCISSEWEEVKRWTQSLSN